jgi:transcriptional regulator with XRE-family HTH domain
MSDKSDGSPVEQVGQVVGQAVEGIGVYIRQQREGAQVSLRQLSKLAGVSNPYLSQVERGLRKPSAEILQQIAKGLRISAEALYVRAGILEERPASAVTDAVLADLELTERQKQVLLEIYLSFRRESESTAPIESTALDPRISGTNGEARSSQSGAQPIQDHKPDPER